MIEEPSFPLWRVVELEERLVRASHTLMIEAEGQPTTMRGAERTRHLYSKAEGVELALSYVRELRR
jgi:hypothetical protein